MPKHCSTSVSFKVLLVRSAAADSPQILHNKKQNVYSYDLNLMAFVPPADSLKVTLAKLSQWTKRFLKSQWRLWHFSTVNQCWVFNVENLWSLPLITKLPDNRKPTTKFRCFSAFQSTAFISFWALGDTKDLDENHYCFKSFSNYHKMGITHIFSSCCSSL